MTLNHWGSWMKIHIFWWTMQIAWAGPLHHHTWTGDSGLFMVSRILALPLPIPYHQRFIPAKLKWKETTMYCIPSRELTYPTLGKGKSSSKCHFGDMLIPWRVIKKHVWCSSVLAVERYAQVPSSSRCVVRHAPRHMCLSTMILSVAESKVPKTSMTASSKIMF